MEITSPKVRDYLSSVLPERSRELETLHRFAIDNNVPIIKHEMEQFLKFLVQVHQPLRILEIGTAIGYSGTVMLQAASDQTILTTLELSDKMADKALASFDIFGLADRVTLIRGDAVKTIQDLEEPYDMIFMDAAKGQYMNYYGDSMRLLKPGGLLVADNILQDGLLVKSRYAIPRRQRTIHGRMREFVKLLMNHPELTTTTQAIADGVCVSYRKKSYE